MHVGPRMTERNIAGTVVWKSGRQLENAHVSVYSANEYGELNLYGMVEAQVAKVEQELLAGVD